MSGLLSLVDAVHSSIAKHSHASCTYWLTFQFAWWRSSNAPPFPLHTGLYTKQSDHAHGFLPANPRILKKSLYVYRPPCGAPTSGSHRVSAMWTTRESVRPKNPVKDSSQWKIWRTVGETLWNLLFNSLPLDGRLVLSLLSFQYKGKPELYRQDFH